MKIYNHIIKKKESGRAVPELLWMIVLVLVFINIGDFLFYTSLIGLFYLTISTFLLACYYHSGWHEKRLFFIKGALYLTLFYTLYIVGGVTLDYWKVSTLFCIFLGLALVVSSFFILVKKREDMSIKATSLNMVLFLLFILCSYLFMADFIGMEDGDYSNLQTFFVIPIFLGIVGFCLHSLHLWMKHSSKAIDRASVTHYKAIDQQITSFFEESMAFTDPNFSIRDLSEALELTEKEVSAYLNRYRKENFYQFIGNYRIAYAAKGMEEKPFYTLDAIMIEAGFRSRPSFIAHFKRVKGIMPSVYRKKIS